MESNEFQGFEGVFGEKDGNVKVYRNTIMTMLQYVLSGKRGLLFMYGQTGKKRVQGLVLKYFYFVRKWENIHDHVFNVVFGERSLLVSSISTTT